MSAVPIGPAPPGVWRSGIGHWGVIALAGVALVAAFFEPLRFMVHIWSTVEEFSYGWFIPAISAFLIWQRADRLRQHALQGNWSGLAVIGSGLVLLVVGELSAIRSFSHYGFVVAVVGLAVCAVGWRGARMIAMPLAILLFMVPLPQFVLRELSHHLQLISSQIGVALIRLAGISVFLEGNVIDLGSYKLQVVEACNGLRYLFPLLVLGFLAAYFYQGAMWKRVLIVVSTAPLTVLINSLRIGLIGITVEYWGRGMAEGILHDLEGWFMFLVCLAALLGEMALLARVGRERLSLRSAFGLDLPGPADRRSAVSWRPAPAPAVAAVVFVVVAAAALAAMPERGKAMPARRNFTEFPLDLPGGWSGRPDHIAPDVLAVLAVDDYFIANYSRAGEPWVNFYTAFYASQSSGQSSHSPRTCIPGGGWVIGDLREVTVPVDDGAAAARTRPLVVNRAVIRNGESKQLVYYWFRQRGHELTDEFEVKWRILSDAVVRDRSDGALLRLVTPLARGEDEAAADERLAAFVSRIDAGLGAYVPD